MVHVWKSTEFAFPEWCWVRVFAESTQYISIDRLLQPPSPQQFKVSLPATIHRVAHDAFVDTLPERVHQIMESVELKIYWLI